MTTVAVIPARYGSTRFHAKALARDTGKYLVQHVYERASQSRRLDRVVVATDDERIAAAVRSFGGSVSMTRTDHESGTDRVGEVADQLQLRADDLVLNVQGDEPEINPETIDQLVEFMQAGAAGSRIGTVAVPFADDGPCEGVGSPLDPNCVKVVLDARGRALYFSRSPIPFPRDTAGKVDRPSRWLLHLGVYAFRADALRMIVDRTAIGESRLASAESLEQLRWLEHGLSIGVVIGRHRSMGIDTPEQYAAFVARSCEPASLRC